MIGLSSNKALPSRLDRSIGCLIVKALRRASVQPKLIVIVVLLVVVAWAYGCAYVKLQHTVAAFSGVSVPLLFQRILYCFVTLMFLHVWSCKLFNQRLAVGIAVFLINFVVACAAEVERFYLTQEQAFYNLKVDLFVPFVIFTASGMRYVQLQDRPITDFPHEVLFLLTSGSKLGMLGIFIEPFVCVVDLTSWLEGLPKTFGGAPAILLFPILGFIVYDSFKPFDIRGCFGYFIVFYSLAYGVLLFPSLVEFIISTHSKACRTIFQIMLMALIFLYSKLTTIVSQRMSSYNNGEHYCFVFAIMIYKQLFWVVMYQAISTMNKEFFLLLVVQASSTFIQCTGLDRYCLSWALSRDFFPEKFRGILTNGDTEYQWKRRLIDSSHTCISTLIVLFLIPLYLADINTGTCFLWQFTCNSGASSATMKGQLERVLISVLFNMVATLAAIGLIAIRCRMLNIQGLWQWLYSYFCDNIILFLVAEQWIMYTFVSHVRIVAKAYAKNNVFE